MRQQAAPACSPCIALLSFLLGGIGGYLVSVALGNGQGGGGGGGGCNKQDPPEAIDDEGNPVASPRSAPAAGAEGETEKGDDRGEGGDDGILIVEGEDEEVGTENDDDNAAPAVVLPAPSSTTSAVGPIRLVLQRYRSASLLIRPPSTEEPNGFTATVGGSEGSCGMAIYVSFAEGASADSVYDAALTAMNLPVLTGGVWGDGTRPAGALDLAAQTYMGSAESGEGGKGEAKTPGSVSVLIVPQANLVCKAKGGGKSLQYHGQIDKDTGRVLYEKFALCVRLIALEKFFLERDGTVPEQVSKAIQLEGGTPLSAKGEGNKSKLISPTDALDASIPPELMFRDVNLYASWDDAGFPLTTAGGTAPAKSAMKKMRKRYEAQRKRHEKYLAAGGTPSGGEGDSNDGDMATPAAVVASKENATAKEGKKGQGGEAEGVPDLDQNFIHIVAGTFGNLQALTLESDMGPFCHVLNLS